MHPNLTPLLLLLLLALCTLSAACWDDEHCRCHTNINYCYDKQKRRHALERCIASSQCFCNHKLECLSIYIPDKNRQRKQTRTPAAAGRSSSTARRDYARGVSPRDSLKLHYSLGAAARSG